MRPRYDHLPVLKELGLPHAWDVLDHELGSLALLTPQRRREAAKLVVLGESVSLDLPLGTIDPPLYGRAAYRHRHIEVGRNTYEDVLDDFNPQSGSQWDGLLHVRARELGFFGGEKSFEKASRGPGIARCPLCQTGVTHEDKQTLSGTSRARTGSSSQ